MRPDLSNNWKNSQVFEAQLALNKKQLDGAYPPHWVEFVLFMRKLVNIHNMLDVGCGCGALYALCKKELPKLHYVGIDYATEAIELAQKTWPSGVFFVADLWALEPKHMAPFQIIHLGAVLDIMPDGDKALDHILSLGPEHVLVGRMRMTDGASVAEETSAYNLIRTYKFVHNKTNIEAILQKHGYVLQGDDQIALISKVGPGVRASELTFLKSIGGDAQILLCDSTTFSSVTDATTEASWMVGFKDMLNTYVEAMQSPCFLFVNNAKQPTVASIVKEVAQEKDLVYTDVTSPEGEHYVYFDYK